MSRTGRQRVATCFASGAGGSTPAVHDLANLRLLAQARHPGGDVESTGQTERRVRGTRVDLRHAVEGESRRSSEDEQIARHQLHVRVRFAAVDRISEAEHARVAETD